MTTNTKLSKKDIKKVLPPTPFFASLVSELDALKQVSIEQQKQSRPSEAEPLLNQHYQSRSPETD